ncbi:unnamed protein product [Gadus morhua 'NCC']
MPIEDDPRLTIANNKIANLKKDIRQLSDELRNKESLLASVMDLAADQSKQIASLSAAFQDTVVWDPLTSTCHRPSSCSPPNRQSSWTEVVIRGCKSGPEGAPTPPLGLSNRYAALSGDSPAPSADAPTVPARSKADRSQNSTPAALQPLVANNAAGSRHRILREAVLRHSGVLPRPQPSSVPVRAVSLGGAVWWFAVCTCMQISRVVSIHTFFQLFINSIFVPGPALVEFETVTFWRCRFSAPIFIS